MSFEDRVAIITGAGQGIGKAIARHLAGQGTAVVIAEIDAEAGAETADELAEIGEAIFLQTDTSDEGSVEALVDRAARRYGRIDALVNNAGISTPDNPPLAELSLENWNRILATNLTGYFLCAKHCVRHLRRRRGAIVNISSTRSLQSEKNTEAYSASKGGVDALTHALAVSLGPEVRVNAINPGWIVVDDWKKSGMRRTPQLSKADHRQHPAGRAGRPEDIASLTAYLVSDAAEFITGQHFVADGGMSVRMIYE